MNLHQEVLTSSTYTPKAVSLNEDALMLFYAGRFDDALLCLKSLRELVSEGTAFDHSLVIESKILIAQGDFTSLKTLQLPINQGYYQASVLINLALAEKQQKHYSQAISLYIKAYKQFKKINNTENTATIENNLATLFLELQNYHKALHYANKAIAHCRQLYGNQEDSHTLNAQGRLGSALDTLANVYLEIKDYAKALKAIEESISILSEKGEQYLYLIESYCTKANICLANKQYTESIEPIYKAKNLAELFFDDTTFIDRKLGHILQRECSYSRVCREKFLPNGDKFVGKKLRLPKNCGITEAFPINIVNNDFFSIGEVAIVGNIDGRIKAVYDTQTDDYLLGYLHESSTDAMIVLEIPNRPLYYLENAFHRYIIQGSVIGLGEIQGDEIKVVLNNT